VREATSPFSGTGASSHAIWAPIGPTEGEKPMPGQSAVKLSTFSPSGQGLDVWPAMPPKDVAAGNPVQRGRYYFEDSGLGLYCGVWDCTAFVSTMAPYSVDEFMILIEGSVTIEEESGRSTTFTAGECFVIPRGLKCVWRQPGYLRKIFVIFEDPDRGIPQRPNAEHAFKVDPNAPLSAASGPDPAHVLGQLPKWSDRQAYADCSGRWSVGVWESTPYSRKVLDFPRHELMHFLKGGPQIRGGADDLILSPGETIFIPKRAPASWESKDDVRKIYCILTSK
jgi:uncharacterized cupin superfamily protein